MGDKALIATGAALSDAVGTLGTVMRYAGDEFVALLSSVDKRHVQAHFQFLSNHVWTPLRLRGW